MSLISVYVAAPRAMASDVDAFHRWAHGHVAETCGRGTSLTFTSTGWVQAVLESKGIDPTYAPTRKAHAMANTEALVTSNVMLAWTAIGNPLETLVEFGRWLENRRLTTDHNKLVLVGSRKAAFLSDCLPDVYIDATGADSLRAYWPRMIEAVLQVMA